MKRTYFFALFLVLFLLCGCAKPAPIEAQPEPPAVAEAPVRREAAPEESAAIEKEQPAQAGLSGEKQAETLRTLDARMAIHSVYPELDMHWLEKRAATQWLLFLQEQSDVYCSLLNDAAYEAELYSLDEIGDYLGALTFEDGSAPVYFKISTKDDTVTECSAADGAQLLAAYEKTLSIGARISPEALPDVYYETILSSIEVAYPDGLYFENPAELSESELYVSFQLFADEDELLTCWNEQAGAYLYSEALIRSALDRYYESYTFRIEDDPLYDATYHAIASQVVGGFGGGTYVNDLEVQAEGSRCTICGTVRDGNGEAMCQKEYMLDFYDGGFYLCAIRPWKPIEAQSTEIM